MQTGTQNRSLITAQISAGELVDKITILEIKCENVTNLAQKRNVERELSHLTTVREKTLAHSHELTELTNRLREINRQLWKVEDDIRMCERDKDFGERFIGLARAVYQTNDRRSEIKRNINQLVGSQIVEEKLYADY